MFTGWPANMVRVETAAGLSNVLLRTGKRWGTRYEWVVFKAACREELECRSRITLIITPDAGFVRSYDFAGRASTVSGFSGAGCRFGGLRLCSGSFGPLRSAGWRFAGLHRRPMTLIRRRDAGPFRFCAALLGGAMLPRPPMPPRRRSCLRAALPQKDAALSFFAQKQKGSSFRA